MPVIQIRSLNQPSLRLKKLLQNATQAVAQALELAPEHVWITWEEILPAHYAEGGRIAGTQPSATHPPLVDVLAFEGRSPAQIERMLLALADTIERDLHLQKGNVFINYREALSGRVYTGGEIVRKK